MVYCMANSPTCFRLDMQEVVRARSRACCRAGRSIEARMAMIAITTRSSISVKYLSLMFHSFFLRVRSVRRRPDASCFELCINYTRNGSDMQ